MNAEFLKVLTHYPELSRRHTASAAVIAPAAILHGTTSKDAIPPTASPDPLINVSQGQTEGPSGWMLSPSPTCLDPLPSLSPSYANTGSAHTSIVQSGSNRVLKTGRTRSLSSQQQQ
ncbi:hypothetical protein HOY82DRAFT_542634 [Tuber indicum]|nr:hypothetical protein HOY82DRAFT_542634 [Tuber indicum]